MATAANRHIDDVIAAVADGNRPLADGHNPAADENVQASWRRSANNYHVDPASNRAPSLLMGNELRALQEPVERCLEIAQLELDRLYKLVRPVRYVILMCNTDGVVIDHRGEENEAQQFRYWGTWLGGMWSENAEGTNGIGTCISEQRPVTVHRSEHFRARHIDLSCSGAPIFGPDRQFMGVLDLSSINPLTSERAHALTGSLSVAFARTIEERLFRDAHCRDWIFAVSTPEAPDSPALISVDGDQHITGIDRAGRGLLDALGYASGEGARLSEIFESTDRLFTKRDRDDFWTRLRLVGLDLEWLAIVTPPEPAATKCIRLSHDDPHLRSRLDTLLAGHPTDEAPSRLRGGLAPGALRRVRDYVDANLDKNVTLEMLAHVAGLSVYHFARTFKQSEGLTPHDYLLERRLAKARAMLMEQGHSLSEIASRAGFADQSHFTRRFRQAQGVSPGQYRRMQK